MADPVLQIGRGGGGGHPDPEIRGGRSPKNIFRSFGPQFCLEIRGSRVPGSRVSSSGSAPGPVSVTS